MTKKGCNTECMISMCSVARLEWYLTDLACLLLGITTVGISGYLVELEERYLSTTINDVGKSVII